MADFNTADDTHVTHELASTFLKGLAGKGQYQIRFCRENEWNPDEPAGHESMRHEGEETTFGTEDMAGRGRGAPRGGGGLKGATWDHDPDAKLESAPSELFPKHPNLQKPRPLTDKERRVVQNYKDLQGAVHAGPLYTHPTKRDPNAPAKTFGEAQFNSQYGTRGKADVDPFTAVETYSMKYDPEKRTIPDLSKIKFDKNMFPQELWSTLEGGEGEKLKKHLNRAMEKKQNMMDGLKRAEEGKDSVGDKSKEERAKILSAKLDEFVEEEDKEKDDDEGDEELQDDDFEDDEDGGDYNAEQYFDDGAEDEDEGGDGGEEF